MPVFASGVVTLVSSCLHSAPFPVPTLNEPFPAYVERWDDWLNSIPPGELRYPDVLRINRMYREVAGGEFPSLQANPGSSEANFLEAKNFVRAHPELARAIRNMPKSPVLGASIHGEDSAMYHAHLQELGIEPDPVADPLRMPLDVLLPQIGDVERLIRVAIVDAYVAIEHEDPVTAISDIRAAVDLLEHLNEPPTFIGYQVQFSRFFLVSLAVQHMLQKGLLTDEELQDLQHSIEMDFIPSDLAMRFELWTNRQTIEWFFEDASADGYLTIGGLSRWYEIDSMMRWDHNPFAFTARAFGTATIEQHRRAIDQLWEAAQLDLERDRNSAAASHYERVSSDLIGQPRFGPLRTLLSAAHPHSMRRHLARAEVRIASTHLAIALHRHKVRHGAFPASLDALDKDLITAEPIDLYTGDSLLYRLTDSGPLIYSAGPDRDDDLAVKETSDPTWMPLDELREILAINPNSIDGDIILFGTP